MRLKTFIISLLFLLSAYSALGQQSKKLFRSDSVLQLTITLPLKDVISNVKERESFPSRLSAKDSDGLLSNHSIKVKVRGKTRARKDVCNFPPLELNFNKQDTKNSIFKGQDKLKLVVHCQKDNRYEDYILKEYLVYKMYQKITPYSFSVRLCQITYVDANKPSRHSTHYGFLIESINDLAKKHDMTVFKDAIRNQQILDKDNLHKLTLFEYMIGNLDWSIPEKHNMKLIIGEKGTLPIAVPYDFDYSGMVDTPYAVPPEGLGVTDVKSRLFRGFCKPNGYGDIIDFYKNIKNEFYNVVNSADFLSEKSKSSMTKYLDSFYKILDNEKYVEKKINRACRADHQHAFEYEK